MTTHGGKRLGAGRKAPGGAKVGRTINVTPEVNEYLATVGNLSVAVEKAVRASKQFKQWQSDKSARITNYGAH